MFDEESVSKDSFKNPKDYVKIVAQGKALAVAEVMIKEGVDCVVVGADTVIVGNRIIFKQFKYLNFLIITN